MLFAYFIIKDLYWKILYAKGVPNPNPLYLYDLDQSYWTQGNPICSNSLTVSHIIYYFGFLLRIELLPRQLVDFLGVSVLSCCGVSSSRTSSALRCFVCFTFVEPRHEGGCLTRPYPQLYNWNISLLGRWSESDPELCKASRRWTSASSDPAVVIDALEQRLGRER